MHTVCENTNEHLKKSSKEAKTPLKLPSGSKEPNQQTKPIPRKTKKTKEERLQLQQERKQARITEAKSRERNDELYQNEKRLKTLRSDEDRLPEQLKVDYVLLKTDEEKLTFISMWKKTCVKRKREQGPDDIQRKVKRRVKCKEELTLYPQRERTLDQVVDDLNNPDLQMEDTASVYTYKFKLNPTLAQRRVLRSYMGAYR